MSNASHEGRHRVSQSELTPSITSKVIVSAVERPRTAVSGAERAQRDEAAAPTGAACAFPTQCMKYVLR